MKNTIKCKLFMEDINSNRIGAEIIERNGKKCSEKIGGVGSCGNYIAVCRDLVSNCDMEIDKDKIITITIEE